MMMELGAVVVLAHEAKYAAKPGNRNRPGKIVAKSKRKAGCVAVRWLGNKGTSLINADYLAPASEAARKEYEQS